MGTPRATTAVTLMGLLLVSLVLATEMWVWLNLWPLKVSWPTALLWSLPLLLIWTLLTPIVVRLVNRWRIEGDHRIRHSLFHVAGSVSFAIASLLLLDVSDRLIHWTMWFGAPSTLVANIGKTIIHIHLGIALYWVVVGAFHAALFQRLAHKRAARAEQLETHLMRARLDVLSAQLQPHFLFNALNSIAVLVHRDPESAEQTLHELSGFLRAVLDRADDSHVMLSEELQLADHYLTIEKTRFQDRLRVDVKVDGDAAAAAVPSLLLQPIIENAVRHGIAAQTQGGIVTISAERRAGQLVMSVRDSGPGISSTDVSGPGVGLTNTKRRLEAMYGADQEFTMQNVVGGGFEVTIVMPYRRHVKTKSTVKAVE